MISTEVRHTRTNYSIAAPSKVLVQENVPVDWQRSNAATISRRIGCVCAFCLVSARGARKQQHSQSLAYVRDRARTGLCVTPPSRRFFSLLCLRERERKKRRRKGETYDPARFHGRGRWSSRQSAQSSEEDGGLQVRKERIWRLSAGAGGWTKEKARKGKKAVRARLPLSTLRSLRSCSVQRGALLRWS